MNWFGKSWGAPCCDPEEHVETPVDQPCLYCEKPITAGAQGIITPLVSFDKPVRLMPAHIDCFLSKVLPHTYSCKRCRGRQARDKHKMSCSYSKHGNECCCFSTWNFEEMTLGELSDLVPKGSRAAKLIELWCLKGESLSSRATREQAIILSPMIKEHPTA